MATEPSCLTKQHLVMLTSVTSMTCSLASGVVWTSWLIHTLAQLAVMYESSQCKLATLQYVTQSASVSVTTAVANSYKIGGSYWPPNS
jgi:hypothetical protein